MSRACGRIGGAEAEVEIDLGAAVTCNDPEPARRMEPTLAGEGLTEVNRVTMAEDFSAFQAQVPGRFVFLGVAPDDPTLVHPNHSPRFHADERGLPIGVELMTGMALGYLHGAQ